MEANPPGDDKPSRLQGERLAAELDLLRKEAERTGNPVFVWRAIAACHRDARLEAADGAATAYDAVIAGQQAVPKSLPDWVLRYLGGVAHEMANLAHGRDAREFLKIADGEWSERQRTAFLAWRAGTLTPKQALALVPAVMGLARPGWNAFGAFLSSARAKSIAFRVGWLRGVDGMTLDDAAARIAQEEGYADARSVLRLVSKARAE